MSAAVGGFVIAGVGPVQPAEPSNSAQKERAPPSAPAPGEFKVDEEAAERALERTLIQRGALLLPVGQMEIEPGFTFIRSEVNSPGEIFESATQVIAANEKTRRNIFDGDVQLRLGMYYDSQVELGFAYRYVSQSRVTDLNSSPFREVNEKGSGFGDIKVGLAKTLVRESGWWPDLVARITWDTATGKMSDGGVLLNGGFNEIIGTLSAVKRQDPLAFIGAVSFQETFEKNNIKPGQQLRFLIGVALAASPETSLRAVLDQAFVNNSKVAGQTLNGSSQTVGILTLGASMLLGRSTLLYVSTDIGLTGAASAYAVRISLGYRFTLF